MFPRNIVAALLILVANVSAFTRFYTPARPRIVARAAATMSEVTPNVKTVAETVKTFSDEYNQPVVPMYRTVVSDLIATTHLTVVDDRFQYDPFFGLGMCTIFDTFFRAYPNSETLFNAMVKALDFEPEVLRKDQKELTQWLESGKTWGELLELFKNPDSSVIGSAISGIKSNEDFMYSRVMGVGVFKAMELTGVEDISDEDLDTWFSALNVDRLKTVKSDFELYNTGLARMREAEQLYKEIEIREKKKLAQRLEEKAKMAAEAAEAASKEVKSEAAPVKSDEEQQSAEV